MERVVILGRGAAGKSTLARRLAAATGLPLIALDEWFWQPGLTAPSRDEWVAIQRELVRRERWIMDGDLGPYDVLHPRLEAADTVIVLDSRSSAARGERSAARASAAISGAGC